MKNVTQSIYQGLKSTNYSGELEHLQEQVTQLQSTLASLLNLMHETSLTREDLEDILPWDFEYREDFIND